MNELKCPSCDTENIEGAKFCKKCGQSLQTELICPSCSHVNSLDSEFCIECGHSLVEKITAPTQSPEISKPPITEPTSFVDDRYQVIRKLGEGGKKKVYLVHDKKLDRDAAFALIKTENLDEDGRKRVTREAQAMGKLGDNPHIVSIFDTGEINGQPYIIIPVMGGGDVEALIEKAPDHKLPLDQTINIAKAVCQGLIFAHSKGVIHRDLKPGNVWLTDDGTAKIGDFGLAVMSDVSRLTMEGMMVGTVSYMPPEQAMGGEVTPKADLYSLGAMLYEMVTGRPPFVGDDSVSIIGQHINAQPISPTWHRADLPPAFESLIMLLLEKDPEKRPNSVKDVLATLESIEKGDIKESVTEQQSPTENPIYRRIFVGRENELKQLQNAFTSAMSGQGALMMVVGEPGIGKTAVCEQLSTFVALRGGITLWGHCYEEGSLSLPYLAFVEAIRSYILDRDADDLKKELGSGASDVARIVSEIREKLRVEPSETQNPEEDRYRLMQAVSSFLANAASVKPMLVILEDLHDSDKGTLDMLSYVSRNLTNTRLLFVGTYRDVEVDRNHPLSAALAELRRVSSFDRVLLRGLNIDEVRRMLTNITQEEVPMSLAEAVHRQTEGNPLFIQEVVRYLVEEGLLTRKDGKWRPSSESTLEMNIPEGLRDVIGKRMSLISKECNQLLSVASVIGRDFSLDLIRKVSGLSEDELFTALEEGKKAAVIEERSGLGAAVTYRFAHAFFRQTLYEEMIAPRRIRLHQQVARALEEIYANRLAEHAAELAEHFSHSSDTADLEKAVSYGEMAAKRAYDVYAYGEAVRLLDQAIKVQEILDPEDKAKRCRLLLFAAEALVYSGEPRRALDTELPKAFSLGVDIGDNSRISQACHLALLALIMDPVDISVNAAERDQWAERADRYAQPDTVERVWADIIMGFAKLNTGEIEEMIRLFKRAFELARKVGDTDAFSMAAGCYIAFLMSPQHIEERLHLAEEYTMQSSSWLSGRLPASMRGPIVLIAAFLTCGQRASAEKIINEHQEMTERTRQVHDQICTDFNGVLLAVLDGRLEESLEQGRQMTHHSEELGIPGFGLNWLYNITSRSHLYLGKVNEALQFEISNAHTAIFLAYNNQITEAVEILEKRVIARPGIGSDEDNTPAWVDILFLETAVITGHISSIELLIKRLNIPLLVTSGIECPTCVSRHFGGAATLLERYDEAREHYKEAIKVCTEMPFRPELALSRLQLAELLLDHYPNEKAEALEHLDFSINEFREMKMQPSLERALRRKDILKA